MLSSPYDPSFSFGSEAANMEYSILSAILGNHSPSEHPTSPPSPDQPSYSAWPIDYPASSGLGTTNYVPSFNESIQIPDSSLSTSPPNYLAYPYSSQPTKTDDVPDQIHFPPIQEPQPQGSLNPLPPRYPRPRSPIATSFLEDPGLLPTIPAKGAALLAADIDRAKSCCSPLQNIHERVTAPYDYTEGYHFLMKHLPTRYVFEHVFCVKTSAFRPHPDHRFPFLILDCRN